MPVATVFENLEDLSADEVADIYSVSKEQISAVLAFVAKSLEAPELDPPPSPADANSL